MLGNQVNGWGHWGFGVGGLLGKAGHNNNIGGVLPDQLDSNTARHIYKQTLEEDSYRASYNVSKRQKVIFTALAEKAQIFLQ